MNCLRLSALNTAWTMPHFFVLAILIIMVRFSGLPGFTVITAIVEFVQRNFFD